MEKIKIPFIKLKEYLDDSDCNSIYALEETCSNYDNTSLKLDIEYKRKLAEEGSSKLNHINEFMYYDNNVLIGYIGFCGFDGDTIEVNGMVHPEYRRQGIFKILYSFVEIEWLKRTEHRMLLLSDHQSVSGLEFIKSTNAKHEHSEYEMYLTGNVRENNLNNVVLIKATNSDAKEIAVQNAIYFRDEFNVFNEVEEVNIEEYSKEIVKEDLILPEEEEKRGFTIYMAMLGDKIIGKVNIELQEDVGGIYAFGVLPQYRGRGYGREILTKAIGILKDKNVDNIMLQVATKNENALNLYKSCGFEQKSIMDYYVISK